jgi:hypothetical protein
MGNRVFHFYNVTVRKDESYADGHEIEISLDGLREGDLVRAEADRVLVNGVEVWKAPPDVKVQPGIGFSAIPGAFLLMAKDESDDGGDNRG